MDPQSSSVQKGESLEDSVTIMSSYADVVVRRSLASASAETEVAVCICRGGVLWVPIGEWTSFFFRLCDIRNRALPPGLLNVA